MSTGAADGLTPRQREILQVNPDHQVVWVAGQVDEVEDKLLGKMGELASALDSNTAQVAANTAEQIETRQRFTWLALTIAITVLTTVIGAVIVGAVT